MGKCGTVFRATAAMVLAIVSLPAHALILRLALDTGIPKQDVAIVTNFNRWEKRPMTEPSPGHYVYEFEEPWLPKTSYKFVVDGRWLTDPANPLSEPDGYGGLNSVLEPREFREDPLLSARPGVPEWVATRMQVQDYEQDAREIVVLSPPAQVDLARPDPVSVTAYFQDGGDYLGRAGVRALLANLSLEPGMPLITGVLIPPKDRMREYRLDPAYARWVARELVPEIEARFPTGGRRERRLLIGPSLGGLATLYAALRFPGVFGLAASQSGSLWVGQGALIPMLGAPSASPSDRLRIFMDCGTYETPDMLDFNRRGFEAAQSAGHSVVYREYPSTHDWIGWRNRLAEIFRYFFSGCCRSGIARGPGFDSAP